MLQIRHDMSESEKAMVHINLAEAYFKNRRSDASAIEKCNAHCVHALLSGHNTGFAAERLAMNLEKDGLLCEAIEVCDLILHDSYALNPRSYLKKDDFRRRREKLNSKAKRQNAETLKSIFGQNDLIRIFENAKAFKL